MANEKQLKILKQGVDVWNKWREKNPEVRVDLVEADLAGVDLREANLGVAYLNGTDLSGADLRVADLRVADLSGVNLSGANLRRADLEYANLRVADLSESDLRGANLGVTDLSGANLRRADLNETDLRGADLNGTDLRGADFSNARLKYTIFAFIDLSQPHGLESIKHEAPSTIGTDTVELSKGEIPEVFLRGCGLSDLDIEYAKLYKPDLNNREIDEILYKIHDIRTNQSIQISPLFISYSRADTPFVEKLEPCFIEKGIRFWRDTHDMKSGRIEKQVDRAMRQNPTVILILSENSTRSDWVEHEARLARDLEKELGRDVLCPIALDDSWKSAKWPARLMEQIKEYNILDYSNWQDDKSFGQVFNKMIAGLDMFYKPESPK
jgi:uncharacterized protein YjbI with pentapeptide repeats